MVKILMENESILSIDLNIHGKYGRTGFCLACLMGHSNVVKLFMEYAPSVNLNHKDNIGRTGFHVSCGWGHTNLVKIFM